MGIYFKLIIALATLSGTGVLFFIALDTAGGYRTKWAKLVNPCFITFIVAVAGGLLGGLVCLWLN